MPLNVAQEAIQMQTIVSLVSSGLGVGGRAGVGGEPRPARRGLPRRSPSGHPRLDLWLALARAARSPSTPRATSSALGAPASRR